MSMFVTVNATVRVKIVIFAGDDVKGLEEAKAVLPNCRLVRPSFWQRSWIDRLFTNSSPDDAVPIMEVVTAQVASSVYAGGE